MVFVVQLQSTDASLFDRKIPRTPKEGVSVYREPHVVVLSTGDELVELGKEPDEGRGKSWGW